MSIPETPSLVIGKAGVTSAVILELQSQLKKRRVVKVRALRTASIGEGSERKEFFQSLAADAGADALTAINTLRATAIDIETTRPILSKRIGGLSGPAIKPVAVRCVYEIYEKVSVPIIGCGGLVTWEDAVEFLLAGAMAVQIGTALMIQDANVFKMVTEGVETYLRRKSFKNVKDIVGLAHKK